MKTTNRLISLFAALLTTATLMADEPNFVKYEALKVDSGFNRDVIAENSSVSGYAISALYYSGTTSCFATQSVIATRNAGQGFTDDQYNRIVRSGWPNDYQDTIRCNTEWGADALNFSPYDDPKLFWLLAPYNTENALCLRPAKPSDENLSDSDEEKGFQGEGTLKFKKIGCYDRLFFLLVSLRKGTVNPRVVTTTVYYTDGTSTSTTFTLTGGLSGEARHKARMTNIFESTFKKNKIEGKEAAYAEVFDIVVDHTKLIDRIHFSNPITNSSVTIFAVTGRTADIAAPDEESTTVSGLGENSFEACWDAIADAASYRLDVAEDPDFQHILADYNNLVVSGTTCQEVAGLIADNDYYWRVRSVNSDGGQSASSAPMRVKTAGGTPPETGETNENIEEMLAEYAGFRAVVPSIKIHRTLCRNGYFNTLCLPFNMNAEQIAASPIAGVRVFEYVRAEKVSGGLNIEISGPIDHIDAGVPYLVNWEPTTPEWIGEDGLVFENVNIVKYKGDTIGANNEVQFIANIGIATMVALDENNLFLGANNTLYWPTGDTRLRGFRSYFKIPTSGVNAAPKNTPARIVTRSEVATDVEIVQSDKVQPTKLIENGQLYILHNGTKYNVQGQVVK